MPPDAHPESEWLTRKSRIDTRLAELGWAIRAAASVGSIDRCSGHALTEYPTANGPADYAQVVDGQILGIVEAKRVSLGPQNVLVQAERYARGVDPSPFDFRGCRVPFLYATNGEVIWFHD